MATALDIAIARIKEMQRGASSKGSMTPRSWPLIVLDPHKGSTGPKIVDCQPVEGTFRSHQVPLSNPASHPEHLKQLEDWLKSYRPDELFDDQGRLKPELADLAPEGHRRMGSN